MMLNDGPAMGVEAATGNAVDVESSLAIVETRREHATPRAGPSCGLEVCRQTNNSPPCLTWRILTDPDSWQQSSRCQGGVEMQRLRGSRHARHFDVLKAPVFTVHIKA